MEETLAFVGVDIGTTSVKAVVNAFADRMPIPGYLFVGASESLLNVTDRFRLDDLEGAFVYVKR